VKKGEYYTICYSVCFACEIVALHVAPASQITVSGMPLPAEEDIMVI